MDAAHLHLIINHIPILGTIFGLVLLGVAWGTRGEVLLKAALVTFAVCGLAAGPVYLSGEEAEDIVETEQNEAFLHEHEEAAELALIGGLALGVLALGALVLARGGAPSWIAPTMFVLALVVTGLMVWTANLGGQISHPNLRDGQTSVQTAPDAGSQEYDDD